MKGYIPDRLIYFCNLKKHPKMKLICFNDIRMESRIHWQDEDMDIQE